MIFEFVVAQTHTPLCRDNTQRKVTKLDFIHSGSRQYVFVVWEILRSLWLYVDHGPI